MYLLKSPILVVIWRLFLASVTNSSLGQLSPSPDPTALPSGAPFDSTLVASTTFNAGFPSTDLLTPLSVTLPPGDYALIFGSGLFGAVAEGFMTVNNTD